MSFNRYHLHSCITVVDVSATFDELSSRDTDAWYRLFRNDVCAMSFWRWWTRYVWRQLNKPLILSASAGHFGGTSNIFPAQFMWLSSPYWVFNNNTIFQPANSLLCCTSHRFTSIHNAQIRKRRINTEQTATHTDEMHKHTQSTICIVCVSVVSVRSMLHSCVGCFWMSRD